MRKRLASNPDVDAYIRDVLTGKIPVGRYTRLAVERHVHDLELAAAADSVFYFDEAGAEHVLDFYRFCRHVEGELAGEPFEPLPWQKFIDWVSFGWRRHSDGMRRFRERWIEVCRGNGKSFWMSANGDYMLVGDGEPGAKVYSAATKEDQAAIVWGTAAQIVQASPELSEILKVYDSVNNRRIFVPGSNAVFRPLAAESRTADGLIPHAVYNDEVHEHRNRKLYVKLKTAMGKRRQPMLTSITTAGDDAAATVYEELRNHAINVLEGWANGDFLDDEFFAIIYALDVTGDPKQDDDPFDETKWIKGNPSLGARGAAVRLEHNRSMAARARTEPEVRTDFLRMHCGIRTSSVTRAIPIPAWDACRGMPDGSAIAWEDYLGRRCILAVDLSSTRDLTALCQLFPPEDPIAGLWAYRWFAWLPKENLREKCEADRVPYDRWAREGWLELTDGQQVDELAVVRRIQELHRTHEVLQMTNDPWHAVQLANVLNRETGIETVGYRQDLKNFGAAVLHFLDEIFAGRLRHDGNPLVRWTAGNVVTKEDADGNKRFHKKASKFRIDPMTSAAMARGRALVILGGESSSPYDDYFEGGEGGEAKGPPPAGRPSPYDDYFGGRP